ncbi:hypothetical protein GYH30_006035 [Glycine max]|nr:hypothetical protein GYH30_006035 [Glycine max]
MTRSRSSTTTTITSSRGNIELPKGHPSHNVVEIIFHTNWGRKPFPSRVKLIFKVQNVSRVVARFKDFLKVIKARIVARLTKGNEGKENVRCITDGNEVMWFHCFGSTEDFAMATFEDSEDIRVLAYGRDLLACEHCVDAVENSVVYVEDVGFFDELRGVPMVVSGEHGGLGLGIHTKDEGLGSFITGNNGKK